MLPSCRGLPLSEVVGTPRPAEPPYLAEAGTLVLPLPHPSGISRWLNHPDHRARVDAGLEWLATERERRGW